MPARPRLSPSAPPSASPSWRANGWPPLPWAILGTGTLPESLRQAADATGAHGLSILVAVASAALAAVRVPRLRTQRSALEALAVARLCAAALVHGRAQLAREFRSSSTPTRSRCAGCWMPSR